MSKQNFEVIMNTPMGKRRGTMELTIDANKISGILCLFRNRQPIMGDIDTKGNCTLHGKFSTLMNQFYFEAVGKIGNNYLQLTLYGGKSIFQMEGHAFQRQETEVSM